MKLRAKVVALSALRAALPVTTAVASAVGAALAEAATAMHKAMDTPTEFILNFFEHQDVWGVHEFEGAARALLYRINRVAGLNVLGMQRVSTTGT